MSASRPWSERYLLDVMSTPQVQKWYRLLSVSAHSDTYASPVEVPERQTPRRDRQYQPADHCSVPYIQSVMEAPSPSVAAINTVHHHHRSPRSQPNKQAKLSEAMGISHNVRQVNASCWKQWLRAFFFLLLGWSPVSHAGSCIVIGKRRTTSTPRFNCLF